ncbi:hypothetical protein Acr_01g0000160 [Actinidia rufa]|uniref:Uncharacterized protein n=1 Tax=Actinidia rufa TaxID=165716 RepID=A0A7J0E3F2_9ERIC|nr:hypothetical protein Acr_01g0000160 [Actinidia rufa]
MSEDRTGDLHVRVLSDSPYAWMDMSEVDDELLAMTEGHGWVSCLLTDTTVYACGYAPSYSLSNDKTVSASSHALS